jgi:DNA-binding PadR family transcriptional regulator
MNVPQSHAPLRPVEFQILLVLAEGEAHGYSIIRETEARTGGRMRLEPGTLYRAMQRLTQQGLIRESDRRPAPDLDDQRRRYFALTAAGREAAAAEARRMARLVEAARAADLLKESGGAP